MNLTFNHAIEHLTKIPNDVSIILVGGQSLCFHVAMYGRKFPHLQDGSWSATTKDIDFLGSKEAVFKCAKAWGGSATYPDKWDNSPSSGIIRINDIEID